MPGWVWAIIVVAAVVIVAIVVWRALVTRRTRTLQGRFGPEYDRTIETADNRRDAERELAARAERRDELDVRPLPAAARDRYVAQWQNVQARFVDDPSGAVSEADTLIQSVMSDRGYPMEDFDQRAADISVDHPRVVENYREGHRLVGGDTEDLRQAMRHYRALFEELVEDTEDTPMSRDESRDDVVRDERVTR